MIDTSLTAEPLAFAPVWRELLFALVKHQRGMLAIKHLSDGSYAHVNDAMAAFLGRSEAELLGHADTELFEPALALALRAAEMTAVAQSVPLHSEHVLERGGNRYEFSVLRMVLGRAGADTSAAADGWLCSVWIDQGAARLRDQQLATMRAQVEDQQRASEELRRELADQTPRDQASGLHTGSHFEEQLRRELDLSAREHREFALVLMEVDPPAGAAQSAAAQERVFEAMGRLLSGGTRAMDASCRIEGRRFAVLLSGVGLATAHSRMEGLRRQCATQIVMQGGQEVRFTVAMGVASFPHTASDRDQLVESSESALAVARSRGGNVVALASIRFDSA